MENRINLNNQKRSKTNHEFKYIEVPKENLQGNRILSIPEKIILTMMDDSGSSSLTPTDNI
jgi:hypothetical protein